MSDGKQPTQAAACERCAYWTDGVYIETGIAKPHGVCRRNAPVAGQGPVIVPPDYWCGEFREYWCHRHEQREDGGA